MAFVLPWGTFAVAVRGRLLRFSDAGKDVVAL